jgi:hypothetical protein
VAAWMSCPTPSRPCGAAGRTPGRPIASRRSGGGSGGRRCRVPRRGDEHLPPHRAGRTADRAGPGDVAFLPRGAAHTLAAEADVVLMCGYLLDRDRPHPLMHDLPDVVHVRAGNPGLRHAIDLLGGEGGEGGARAGSGVLLPALLDVASNRWWDWRCGWGRSRRRCGVRGRPGRSGRPTRRREGNERWGRAQQEVRQSVRRR